MLAVALMLGTAATLNVRASAQSKPSDWLKVWDASGALQYQVSCTEQEENVNGPSYAYIIPVAGLVDASLFGHYTTVYEAPGSNVVSDVYGVAFDGTGYYLGFASDTDTAPVPFGGGGGFSEYEINGAPNVFDATRYLDRQFQAAGWTAAFWSDAEQAVPEAGSLVGMGLMLGVGGLGLLRLRKA